MIVDPIMNANFTVYSYAIVPGNSYNIDFFADLNGNRMYDKPPTDHAWRLQLMNVMGDTTLSFTHNTSFTDIGLPTGGGGGPSSVGQTEENLTGAYPNPVINTLNVDLGKLNSNMIEIQIYNSAGKVLMDQQRSVASGRLTLEMGGLQPGMYILKVNDGNTVKALRFIKE